MQGVAVTEEGWRFPPFIVVERGESLDEWRLRIQPDFPTIVQVLSHVTERVKTMHDLGLIHRDLKPGNVLWRPGQHSWTLIDFGCAAKTGMKLPILLQKGSFMCWYQLRMDVHSHSAPRVDTCMHNSRHRRRPKGL